MSNHRKSHPLLFGYPPQFLLAAATLFVGRQPKVAAMQRLSRKHRASSTAATSAVDNRPHARNFKQANAAFVLGGDAFNSVVDFRDKDLHVPRILPHCFRELACESWQQIDLGREAMSHA
jgi:hypothetical protein